ncbi:hypothetical protein KSP39_PZI014726 [Platanthera zijinensis]|uniref:Inhibitor I9 domain-containing protein n=1 Tax=Platanthera zijinensis TaxID=2320716 RepID=A0AAP0BAU1_9ASPA
MAHTSLSPSTDSLPPLYTYIVHVRRPPVNLRSSDADSLQKHYLSFLPKSELDSSSSPRLIYAYDCMSSFAARLTEEEASAMSSIPGFILAYKSRDYDLHTTRNPTSSASGPKPDYGANPMKAKVLSAECSTPFIPNSSIMR